jgi:3-oxoacyl-[acyl-carrier protein] reductase
MLKGKTALITGSSRGIGKAIALKFAEYGAFVGINYNVNEKAANNTLRLIKKNSGSGILLKADVSLLEEVEKMVNKFLNNTNKIDILVNNAGIYFRNSFISINPEIWSKVMSVNLTSCYNLCREVIPHMKKNNKIIFISSQLAFKGSSHGSDYATSKAGMLGLMRCLALELAEKKINVNAVAPGTIDTDIIRDYSTEMRRERINEIPLGRLGKAEDIANACLFLASNLSDYITGETINVNGGLYIH